MVVNPSVPVKTIPEFIAYAKANPGKLFMGSSGNGSLPHILGVLFEMKAGVDLVHVPYKESVFPDLLGGQVQLAFEPVPAVIGYIKAGKLRALGVSTKSACRCCPMCRRWPNFCPATRRPAGSASARRRIRLRSHRHPQQGGQGRACRSETARPLTALGVVPSR